MKKFGVLLTSIIVAGSLGTTAFADTTTSAATTVTTPTTAEDTAAQNAGITPDSIFYPIDVALDNLKIALANGTIQKAQIELKVANERLSESIVMSFKNKPSLAAAAAQKYNTNITNAEDTLKTELQNNTNTDDTNTNNQAATLEQQVITEEQNDIDDLKDVESTVPEDAKQEISNVIETQTAKAAAVQNMVQKLHALNDARKAYNKAEVALKKVQKSGDAAAISTATSTLTASQTAYNQAKEAFAQAFQSKQEAVKKANTSTKSTNTDNNSTATGTTSGTTQPTDTTASTSTAQPTNTTQVTASTQPAGTAQVTSSTQISTVKEYKDNDENDDAAKKVKSHDNNRGNSDNAKSAKDTAHKDKK